MKRAVCAALVCALLFCGISIAESLDYSAMTLEELYQLRDEIDAQIDARESEGIKLRYESGSYLVGRDMPEGDYVLVENHDAIFSGIVVKASEDEDAELVSYRFINRRAAMHLARGTVVTLTDATAYPAGSAPAPELVDGAYPEGAYIIGSDLPAGEYTLTPDEKAPLSSYSVYSGIPGAASRTLRFEVLREIVSVALSEGEYIEMSGCTMQPQA